MMGRTVMGRGEMYRLGRELQMLGGFVCELTQVGATDAPEVQAARLARAGDQIARARALLGCGDGSAGGE